MQNADAKIKAKAKIRSVRVNGNAIVEAFYGNMAKLGGAKYIYI